MDDLTYIFAEVYRGAVIISEIRTFTTKKKAEDYKAKKQKANPHTTYRIWGSVLDSETYITKMVK